MPADHQIFRSGNGKRSCIEFRDRCLPTPASAPDVTLIIPAPPIGRYGGEIGIVLDPLHKEVIIATASGNTVVTYSVPEVFD